MVKRILFLKLALNYLKILPLVILTLFMLTTNTMSAENCHNNNSLLKTPIKFFKNAFDDFLPNKCGTGNIRGFEFENYFPELLTEKNSNILFNQIKKKCDGSKLPATIDKIKKLFVEKGGCRYPICNPDEWVFTAYTEKGTGKISSLIVYCLITAKRK